MDHQQVRLLLHKYRSGKCSAEEKELIEKWYNIQAKKGNGGLSAEKLDKVGEDIWTSVNSGMDEGIFKKRKTRNYTFRIAASVIFILAIGFSIKKFGFLSTKQVADVQFTTLQTSKGKIEKYVLPDSSIVTLNAGSILKYASDFNKQTREVILQEGEVYFDIFHNPKKPFTVRAGRTKTQVLGTAFSIRSYHELNDIEIVVARGKVSVQNTAKSKQVHPAYLIADDQLIVDKKSGYFIKNKVDSRISLSWLKGKVQLHNESLAVIGVLLEKRFGITVRFQEENISSLRFNTGFEDNDTLDEILENLSLASEIHYKRRKNEVIFSIKPE